MSSPNFVLGTLYSLALLFAAILALWLAGRIILRNISQIRGFKDDFASKRLLILMMWLALGGLFVIPLIDLIGVIDAFVATFVPLFAIPAAQFVTAAGMEPSLFTGMRGALLLLVYGFALWLGLKVSRSWDIPIDLPIQLTPLEKNIYDFGPWGISSQCSGRNCIWCRIYWGHGFVFPLRFTTCGLGYQLDFGFVDAGVSPFDHAESPGCTSAKR